MIRKLEVVGAVILATAALLRPGAARGDTDVLRAAFVDRIAARIGEGQREWVLVEVGGRLIRGKATAADRKALTVMAKDMKFQVPWSSLSPKRFFYTARRFTPAASFQERLALARLALASGLNEEAAKELAEML